jgi:homoaconitase/3-isopropylmalate dehydratase large subunit
MGMTITEKILADHAGKREVHPGELIDCRLDLLMGNDIIPTPAPTAGSGASPPASAPPTWPPR